MTSNQNPGTTKTPSIRGDVPPFGYYLAFLFLSGVFFIFLDFNFRGDELFRHLPIPQILRNLVFTFLFVYGICLITALILWFTEWLLTKLMGRYIYPWAGKLAGKLFPQDKPRIFHPTYFIRLEGRYLEDRCRYRAGSITGFIMFAIFVYVNVLYMKFWVGNYITHSMASSAKLATFVFAILLILYLIRFQKKLTYKAKAGTARFLSRLSLFTGAVALVAGIIIFNAYGKVPDPPARKSSSPLPHVIMITSDSLAKNRMSVYGYHKSTTPRLEEFARESCLFEGMVINSNETHYSLPSFLGRNPREYDVNRPFPLTLINEMEKAGYNRRVFVCFTRYSRAFNTGFTRVVALKRFDKTNIAKSLYRGENRENFYWLSGLLSEDERYYNLLNNRHPKNFNRAIRQVFPLDMYFDYVIQELENSPEPVFIWAHVFEPHHPYIVPNPFYSMFGPWTDHRYDGAVAYLDHQLGIFFDRLREKGLYDDSLIIFSSDHGESFGEKHAGWSGFLHGTHWLNESVNRIPLIIRLPGQTEPVRPLTFASQVDVAPTILDIVGHKIPQWMEGESLIPYINEPEKLSDRLKIVVPASHFGREHSDLSVKPMDWASNTHDMFNVYTGDKKIGWFQIYAPSLEDPRLIRRMVQFQFYCVFNIIQDPTEEENLLLEPEMEGLLDKVYNYPLVERYRTRQLKDESQK